MQGMIHRPCKDISPLGPYSDCGQESPARCRRFSLAGIEMQTIRNPHFSLAKRRRIMHSGLPVIRPEYRMKCAKSGQRVDHRRRMPNRQTS
jgi:hypothetical protein